MENGKNDFFFYTVCGHWNMTTYKNFAFLIFQLISDI